MKYAITCLMTKPEITGTLSVKEANSPAEAKRLAVEWALQAKPGFSVHEVLVQEISETSSVLPPPPPARYTEEQLNARVALMSGQKLTYSNQYGTLFILNDKNEILLNITGLKEGK